MLDNQKVWIYYTNQRLVSGQQASIKVKDGFTYYFFALTADQVVEGVNIEVALTGNCDNVGIVYSARKLALKRSNIIFYQMSVSIRTYCAFLSEETLLYNSNISFLTAGQVYIEPILTANITSIINSTTKMLINNQAAGKLNTPPCEQCILPDQDVDKNCFGCVFGQIDDGNDVCICEYANSTMNPDNGICENLYEDHVDSNGNLYYSECRQNAQLTIKYDGAFNGTSLSVFKDDNCNIVNVFVDGSLTVYGTLSHISGLVRYALNDISFVYSSLNIWSKIAIIHYSLICNEINGNIAFTGITLNGRLNNTRYAYSNEWMGGVLTYAPAGSSVTMSKIRILGLVMFGNNHYSAAYLIGRNQGKAIINDVLINTRNNLNLTGAPISPTGIDYADVDFPCKSQVKSAELKDSLKLQLTMKAYTFTQQLSEMRGSLHNAGGIIGHNFEGEAVITNVVANFFLNGSSSQQGGFVHFGLLVGYSQHSKLSVSNAYCDGNITAHRYMGVVGMISNGTAQLVVAASFRYNADQYAGFLGGSNDSTIDIKTAVNGSTTYNCWHSSTFGPSRNTIFTVTEAVGKMAFTAENCVTYLKHCYTTQFNGQICDNNGQLSSVPDLYINECS